MKNLQRGIQIYESFGLSIKLGEHIANRCAYLAGTDEERAQDVMRMFSDPSIKGVFSAYGGYGAARIAELLDYKHIKANPKVFWGYSDSTFLQNAIYQNTGLVTFHGPMMSSDLGEELPTLTEYYLRQIMEPMEIVLSQLHVLSRATGTISAPVVGGNLTLLVSTLATPFEIDTRGKILFIEDVDEEPYRLDRLLNQLRMSGKLEQAKSVIVGDFHRCVPHKRQDSFSIHEILTHHLELAGVPTMTGLQIGHCSPTVSIPLGSEASIDFDQQTITFSSGVKGE